MAAIVNVLAPGQRPRHREPADDPDAPLFCLIEVGRGEGKHASSSFLACSRVAAAVIHRELGAMLASEEPGR